MPSNAGIVYSLQFSPDGKFVAASDILHAPPTTRLIDARTHEPIGNPFVNSGVAGYVSFSADDKTIAMPSSDETILWAADPMTWRARACDIAGRNLTKAEVAQYLPALNTSASTCPQYPAP